MTKILDEYLDCIQIRVNTIRDNLDLIESDDFKKIGESLRLLNEIVCINLRDKVDIEKYIIDYIQERLK